MEILVILACICILLAILCPILSRVRQTGYQTKCAANMEQLGKAFQTYAQDWSDYWPCPGGLRGDYAYWTQTGPGGLNGYVKQRGFRSVWCCPLMPHWIGRYDPRSYSMNSYLREPADVEYPGCTCILKGIRSANIPRMNQTILLFEGLPLLVDYPEVSSVTVQTYTCVYIYRCCNWSGVKGYAAGITHTIDSGKPWHSMRSNYVMADGHLVNRTPGRKHAGLLSTHKEMFDWYVDKGKFENETWPYFRDKCHAPYE